MTQQNLEIFGNEWRVPSLAESEYPELIHPLDSIASEDFLDREDFRDRDDFRDREYFLDPGYYPDLENSPDPEYSPRLEYESDSEHFLASEYSPGSEYPRDLEDSLASEYSPDLRYPPDLSYPPDSGYISNLGASPDLGNLISSQEIDFDSLTGMPNDSTLNRNFNTTTALRDIGFAIQLFSNTNQARVTATVRVELSPFVRFLVQEQLVNFVLQSNIWGVDNYRPFQGGADDYLFDFPNQTITGEGTYTFSRMVPRSALNEDRTWWINRVDEIQNRFRLVSSEPALPLNLNARTHIITGLF